MNVRAIIGLFVLHNKLSHPTMVSTRRSASSAKASAAKTRSTGKKSVSKTSKATKATSRKKELPKSKLVGDCRLLFALDPDDTVEATLIGRPSQRNKSPYVGDILVDSNRTAIAHLPNLEMGGKCVPGVTLLVKHARDRKGNKVPATAVNPKYNTPKCEFIAQVLLNDDSNIHPMYQPTWIGAHPSLGETIGEIWLREQLLYDDIVDVQTQVNNPCGIPNIRSDFMVTHADGTKRIVEVKTVVDTDFCATAAPQAGPKRPVFVSDKLPYVRTGIFPWGNSKQKGPDGEAVVSTRAIHHVRELTKIATGEYTNDGERCQATLLFVVIRGDAQAFRPNANACPSFAKYLKIASDSGVQILARNVRWDRHQCFDGINLPIDWPTS